MIAWLSQQGPSHPKHQGWHHPVATCLVHYGAVGAVSVGAHDALVHHYYAAVDRDRDTYYSLLPASSTAGNAELHSSSVTATAFCILVYAVWLLIWRLGIHHQPAVHSSAVLYEYCWLCNVTLVLSAAALYYQRPVIASACCVVVGIDQLLWYVDLAVYGATGTFPVGVSKYIFWKGTSWKTRITCTHHLWTLPVLLKAAGGLHFMALPLSVPIMVTNVCLSRWMTPSHIIVVPVAKTTGAKTTGAATADASATSASADPSPLATQTTTMTTTTTTTTKYLNVNLSHELWTDISIRQLQIHKDHPAVHVYLWRLLWRWAVFNSLVFGLLHCLCSRLLGGAPMLGPVHR